MQAEQIGTGELEQREGSLPRPDQTTLESPVSICDSTYRQGHKLSAAMGRSEKNPGRIHLRKQGEKEGNLESYLQIPLPHNIRLLRRGPKLCWLRQLDIN